MTVRDELVQVLIEVLEARPEPMTCASTILIWQRLIRTFSLLLNSHTALGLFIRSVEANRWMFSWLPQLPQVPPARQGEVLFSTFALQLSSRPACEADRVTRALLGTYIDLLVELIGETLTMHYICQIASPGYPNA